jgi:hypothetical protein
MNNLVKQQHQLIRGKKSEMNKGSQPLPHSVIYSNKGRHEPDFKIPRYIDWEAVVQKALPTEKHEHMKDVILMYVVIFNSVRDKRSHYYVYALSVWT